MTEEIKKKDSKNKNVKTILFSVIAILVIFIGTSFVGFNKANQNILIVQVGEVVDVKTEPGIFFKIPIIQKTKSIYVGERLYDVQASDVITSDKKSMIANCYVTWQVTEPKKFYQTLSAESVAQSRIDVAVYNAMKKIISSTTQDEIISGKDGSLGKNIMEKISLGQYGITVTQMEVKVLDLPNDNKTAVYSRMISERQAIAAEYKANGERDNKKIRSATDAMVRQTVSEAQVTASQTEAEGETLYFQTLAEAYGASPERKEFYNFIVGLDAMKESLINGGTMTIDKSSPLYSILNNQQPTQTNSAVETQ